MIARLCAAQLARQIVRALHVNAPEQVPQETERGGAEPKKVKARKKRRAA